MTIGFLGAFLGGLLSLLSPCSALLLPAFFAYAFSDRVRLLLRTGIFYLGLATTLVPMGVAAGSVGALLNQHRGVVVLIGGLLMIALGVAQILGFGFGSNTAQRLSGRFRMSSTVSVFLLGTVYGLAGFCAGPLLGGVLTMAMTGSSPAYGGALLAVYALGMAVPLFVIAALWDRFDLGRRRWLRGRELRLGVFRVHSSRLLAGLVFIALGALFIVSDGTGALAGVVGIDQQFAIQSWVRQVSSAVPDRLLVALLAALVALVSGALWLRSRRAARPRTPGGSPTGSSTPPGPSSSEESADQADAAEPAPAGEPASAPSDSTTR